MLLARLLLRPFTIFSTKSKPCHDIDIVHFSSCIIRRKLTPSPLLNHERNFARAAHAHFYGLLYFNHFLIVRHFYCLRHFLKNNAVHIQLKKQREDTETVEVIATPN